MYLNKSKEKEGVIYYLDGTLQEKGNREDGMVRGNGQKRC